MFEKFFLTLFKLLAFIHLLLNQAVTFGKRKEEIVCMNFKILMLKNNLNMGYIHVYYKIIKNCMQNQIDTLRQLNYELIKNLGLFRQRAGLSFGQRHTLYHINAHQGLSIQELAELLQVDHSTMSRNVKKLMQADLVETFQDDADKRRKMITLSAVGRQVLAEATESINLTISNALQSLDEDEIENVITNLRKYSKALEGVR